MAIQFLHDIDVKGNIDLSGNELQNAVLQHLSGNPAVVEGRIYYNTANDAVMVCLGGTWTELSTTTGDITGVTAGTGMTGGGDSGSLTLNVVGGDGITANADDIAITPAQTTITSIFATDLIIGEDAETAIDFGTANEIDFKINNTTELTLDANALYPTGDAGLDLGTSALEFKDAWFDGTVTSDAFAGPLTGNADTATVATTVTITDNESTDEDNAIIFAAGGDVDGGNIGLESDGTLTYNPSDGKITATGFVGALTGQADTVGTITGLAPDTATTQATQGAITSLGTLTTLTVDNILINATTISTNGGTDLNITPLAGQQIVLDGTIIIDAGVVTGATSITSTAFAGALTGDVTGTASLATVTNSTDNTNFPIVFNDESDALLDDTGALYFNPFTGLLTVPHLNVAGTTTQVNTVTMEAANAVIFEGATVDAHETTLTITDPTADRTITLPNATGTIALTSDITGTNSNTNTGDNVAATDATAGIVELATTAEALTGTDTTRAVTAAGLAARSYTNEIGDGELTTWVVTHNLGTRAVIVQMYDSGSYETVYASVVRNSTTQVTITFTSAPATSDITVMITKIQ